MQTTEAKNILRDAIDTAKLASLNSSPSDGLWLVPVEQDFNNALDDAGELAHEPANPWTGLGLMSEGRPILYVASPGIVGDAQEARQLALSRLDVLGEDEVFEALDRLSDSQVTRKNPHRERM